MKSFGTRLEEIASWEALREAWFIYCSGKRRRPAVAAFELDADSHLLRMSRALLSGTYRHGDYRLMRISEPKERLIAISQVRDRILHTSVYRALGPLFNASFIGDTYACLEGRGSHRAVLRFMQLQRQYKFLVHLDIRCYYPSVDHAILKNLLVVRVRDGRIHRLFDDILGSGARLYRKRVVRDFFDSETNDRDRGLPIGNLTSQWWGNLYLDGLDHFVKRELKCSGYLRYMDDFICFADDRNTLRAWIGEIEDWLHAKRRLSLNPKKGHLQPAHLPHVYLGYRVTRAGFQPARTMIMRFRRRLKAGLWEDPAAYRQSLQAWKGAVFWP